MSEVKVVRAIHPSLASHGSEWEQPNPMYSAGLSRTAKRDRVYERAAKSYVRCPT